MIRFKKYYVHYFRERKTCHPFAQHEFSNTRLSCCIATVKIRLQMALAVWRVQTIIIIFNFNTYLETFNPNNKQRLTNNAIMRTNSETHVLINNYYYYPV